MKIKSAGLFTIFLLIWSSVLMAEPVYYKDTETLPYKLVKTLTDDIEIREYPAAVAVASSGNSENGSFRLLFKYISGDNVAKQEIAMTSPVEINAKDQMMFFLPSKFTIDTAPVPTHPDVSLREIPARKVAAIRFSGLRGDGKRDKYKKKLLTALKEKGYETSGEPSFMGYDSPFAMPWTRRNEIIVSLKEKLEPE